MSDASVRLNAALAGRYRIERELGTGGMATVYLAEDLKHDRKVAIKVLKPELAAVLGAERFVVEIKTTAAMSHPHILPLFDSGTADSFLFYVMPYIEGETIRDKLNRETQFGVDEAVRIAREVADALDYAHRHGVIHRDIKPENILLHDGRAMVMDFGIALAVSAAAGGRMTETGLSLGTPHYMSPEQATAEKEITARADQYSLASVLYEMLTGNPPHTGAAAQQIIMKIITEPAESVTKYRKAVPANIASAVAKALEKLPADRFESAKAFADALANPTFATAAHTGVNLAGVRGVSRRVYLATAAVAVLALSAAGWLALRPAPAKEVLRLSVALPDSQQLTTNSATTRVAISPNGRQVVMVVGLGTGPNGQRLWIRSLDQLRATPIAGTEGATNPSFSPDGKHIAFISSASPRAVRVVPAAGGAVITLTDSLVDTGGLAWGNDGYIYYDGHLEGDGLARIRESGGTPEIATRPIQKSEAYHVNPSPLPHGRGLLFSISRIGATGQRTIGVLDARTGKHASLMNGVAARYVATGHLLYVTENGVLMAVPFDLDGLRVTGDAVAVLDGVAVRGNGIVDADVAPNGLLVYTAGSAGGSITELVWVGRDGSAKAVDPQFARAFRSRPVISPDGKMVAVSIADGTEQSVWIKVLDRGPASKLAAKGNSPAWSHDGKSIFFMNGTAIMRVPTDGSTLPVKVFNDPAGAEFLNVTRDGKWLVYNNLTGRLYALPLPGDSAIALIPGNTLSIWPAVSPDGHWIAYSSDEAGQLTVTVRPFPDAKVTKREVSQNSAYVPLWSRDGRELFYVDDAFDMYAVPILPGTAFTFGAPTRLFSGGKFAVNTTAFETAPDGKRFLMTRALGDLGGRNDELILVQNFPEELRAKVKPK